MTILAARIGALADTVALPDPGPLAEGQARFAIEHFALTANNVTYAVHGEDFAYWRFFPAPEGFGIVPVWGFARVTESRAAGVAVGDRVFGYWPMGAQAVLTPVHVSPHGFTDGAAHRAGLPPFYNRYTPASPDWGDEALQCLFRPLYATSFLIDAMIAARPVDTLLLSSASSKTALGVAQAARGRQRVVGLTAPANRAFCAATGLYDQVLSYDDIAAVSGTSIAFIDFSGHGPVREAVHTLLGDRLAESHVVGDTHWQAPKLGSLPGPAPQMFFAPTVAQARVAEWGPAGFDQRLAAAWGRFAATLGWLQIRRVTGAADVAAAWADLVAGRIDPAAGIIASL
ncbi:MAG: DUF2855 family protein [Sphingomonadales bacterium]|jgi:hypothetical protein